MANIIKLDQKTANLIAAGEVIERAASVVKELVENAIDADATMININLVDSGLTEIIVSDNGCGMTPVDAKMSIEPHATSKIKTGEDLFRIFTLGFRGEALPSIVSVSNFRIKTSEDGKRGFMLSLKGGQLINEALIAFPKGTEVSVKNLFFNTPARLQNLQSPSIELSHIVDYVNRIALARPDIAFKLTNNDRVLLQTYGNNKLDEVIYTIYGEEVTKNMLQIFQKNAYFEVSGLISKPTVSRSNKNHINILVNNRVIRNYKIISAVLEGYRERLVTGRFPIAVIKIEVDPSIIDVNVHPGKLEVRFSNEMELLEMICYAIKYALDNANLIVEVEKPDPKESKTYSIYDSLGDDEDVEEDNKEVEESSKSKDLFSFEEDEEYEKQVKKDDLEEIDEEIDFEEKYSSSPSTINKAIFKEDDSYEDFRSFSREDLKEKEEEKKEEYIQEEYELHTEYKQDARVNKLPVMYYVGQLHGTYLLFQDEENMYIVDQHAAYERINYEKIKDALNNEKTIHYELLIPIKLNFTTSEAILVREVLEELKSIGIIIEDFGSGTFMVREVPIWFTKGKEKEFVEEIIFEFVNNKKVNKYSFFDNLAILLACKRSIKANQYLDKIHIEYLMEDLGKCEKPYSCPHGRPTIVKFSKNEIERWFKRSV